MVLKIKHLQEYFFSESLLNWEIDLILSEVKTFEPWSHDFVLALKPLSNYLIGK